MENLKKELKKKLIFNCIMLAVFLVFWIVLMAFEATGILKAVVFSETGMAGGAIGGGAVCLIRILEIKQALKDEEKLKKLLIKTNDERLIMISKAEAHLTLILTLFLLFVGMIVFSYINRIVFYTLFCVFWVIFVLLILTDIYYRRKY